MKKAFFIFFSICIFITTNSAFARNVYEQFIPEENEVIFNQSTFNIDVIDPISTTNLKGLNYPGLRGTNQLVVYTSAFGTRTNTNEFGTEAIVTGDIVSSLSGADSLIPYDGLVISGHGNAKKWINENIMVGSKIYIDSENKTITSYITSDTFLYTAKERINEVQDMLAYYCKTCDDYNSKRTEQNLIKAQDYIYKAQKNSEDCQKYASRAIEYANAAMATVVPYSAKELKGVWIRPTYFCRNEIENVLNDLQDKGINNIFIETYYHGKTIFPSYTMEKYGFIKQYEDYLGFDPLKIWISEAHKRGIKVHVWFQTFYVGNTPPETNPLYILAKKPDWANRQKKNADSAQIPYSVSEHNGYFIDPANPEVQDFLYELLCEIIKKYKPDGINLDYIRYPQSLSSNYSNYDQSNWGYTTYARNEFKTLYGTDPIELTKTDYLWDYWKYYRYNKVNTFVKRIGILCRNNSIVLTTVIFPNKKTAMDTKLQDWRSWSLNGYVNGFTPLFLTCDDKTEANLIEEILRNKALDTKVFGGLFVTFMNGSETDLIKQIHMTRKYDLNGVILFDYAHYGKIYDNALNQSIFNAGKRDVMIMESAIPKQNKQLIFGKQRK
ncbi:MAG: family 10 glycosylhydrolase [bacterium]|nr:family 10 glycosylhydrolase [bacterium]